MSMQYKSSDFIERLGFLMDSHKESELTLAQKLGISVDTLVAIFSGKVSPSIDEVYRISSILEVSPSSLFLKNGNILDKLDLSVEEFQWSMENNPSLRGVVIGYVAELKLREIFEKDPRIERMFKYDDHDRKKKSDLVINYQGKEFSLEVKSLQTNTVRDVDGNFDGIKKKAKFQCDASDCRTITLPDGQEVTTTLLKYGDFDILAVNLFAFYGKWEYAFALNRDLPHSTSKKYTESQQKQLIASLIPITYPIQAPFVSNPFELLDKI